MPWTAAEIRTTTKTPTAMPRIVRPARTLLERIDSSAIITPSKAEYNRVPRFIGRPHCALRPAHSALSSCCVAKRGDGVEQGGATRRIYASGDTDRRSHSHTDEDRPELDRGGQRRHQRNELRQPDARCDAHH